MPDLHARLLAEIERREDHAGDALGPDSLGHPSSYYSTHGPTQDDWNLWVYAVPIDTVLAYLAALRGVVELHRNAGGGCHECEYDWPCASLRCVAEGLGVEA